MNQISQDSKNEDDGMLDDDIYGDLESSIYLTARNPNCRTVRMPPEFARRQCGDRH